MMSPNNLFHSMHCSHFLIHNTFPFSRIQEQLELEYENGPYTSLFYFISFSLPMMSISSKWAWWKNDPLSKKKTCLQGSDVTEDPKDKEFTLLGLTRACYVWNLSKNGSLGLKCTKDIFLILMLKWWFDCYLICFCIILVSFSSVGCFFFFFCVLFWKVYWYIIS